MPTKPRKDQSTYRRVSRPLDGRSLVAAVAAIDRVEESLAASPLGDLLAAPVVDPETDAANVYIQRLGTLEHRAYLALWRAELSGTPYEVQAALRTCIELSDRVGRWTGDFDRAARLAAAAPGNLQGVTIQLVQVGGTGPGPEPVRIGPGATRAVGETPAVRAADSQELRGVLSAVAAAGRNGSVSPTGEPTAEPTAEPTVEPTVERQPESEPESPAPPTEYQEEP